MTTINIKLTNICSGGGHLTFSITGAVTQTVPVGLTDLSEPIEEDDVVEFCKIVARMAKFGRTMGQARTLLQNGVDVTV